MGKKKSRVAQKTKQIQANVVDLLDLPSDVMLDLPKFIMIGNQELLVENHRGIIEYSQNKIRVNSSIGQIMVTGENLMLKNLKADEILVEGQILRIILGD